MLLSVHLSVASACVRDLCYLVLVCLFVYMCECLCVSLCIQLACIGINRCAGRYINQVVSHRVCRFVCYKLKKNILRTYMCSLMHTQILAWMYDCMHACTNTHACTNSCTHAQTQAHKITQHTQTYISNQQKFTHHYLAAGTVICGNNGQTQHQRLHHA